MDVDSVKGEDQGGANEGSGDHDQLVRDIRALTKQKRPRGKSSKIEEGYHELHDVTDSATTTRKLYPHELARLSIVKKTKSVNKALRLAKSKVKRVSKSEQHKALRKLAVRKAKKDVSFWQPYVQAQRMAETVYFTAGVDKVSFLNEHFERIPPAPLPACTPLQRELDKLSSQNVVDTLSVEPNEGSTRLIRIEDARQIEQTTNEIKRMRALVARQVEKNRRIKRAKGRHFRRLLRKQKEKKDVQILAQASGEISLPELNKRAEERMTMKHKSRKRKIQRLLKYAKNNPVVRQILNDRLDKSNRLKQRDHRDDSDNCDLEDESQRAVAQEYHDLKRLEKQNQRALKSLATMVPAKPITFEVPPWMSGPSKNEDRSKVTKSEPTTSVTKQVDILEAIGDCNEDVDMTDQIIDFSTDEFAQMKSDVAKHRASDEVQNMPGWNCWSGGSLGDRGSDDRRSRRYRKGKRVDKQAVKVAGVVAQPNVIINAEAIHSTAFQKHQVKRIPFPFKSIVDYEDSLKQPLGREWNPATVYKTFNAPNVVTLPGRIIEPVRRDVTDS